MKIYTKQGDAGTTSLIGGVKVKKSHLRLECYGTVDELNATIGYLKTLAIRDAGSLTVIGRIQDRLFVIGSQLASENPADAKLPSLNDEDVGLLEGEIDRMSAKLPPLRSFILPGGVSAGAWCHVARCVCRRAERLVVALNETRPVDGRIIVYLNRLSDYLFVLARAINQDSGFPETPWKA